MSQHQGTSVQYVNIPLTNPQGSGQQKQPPIMMQPMGGYGNQVVREGQSQMTAPQPISYLMPNVPRGLEYLTSLNQLFIRQKVELLEAFLGCETKNKFEIFDSSGRQIFYAEEDTNFCTRQCLGKLRPFDMRIRDGHGYEAMHLARPLACGSCCYPCCLQSIEVQAPPGIVVGTVEQEWSFIIPQYKVKDTSGNVVLRIEGPCCTVSCCRDVEFKVLSADGVVEVGKISKKWSGLSREFFTDADNFGIIFPMDLDVKMKAVMLGACMLIDFMFFETSDSVFSD